MSSSNISEKNEKSSNAASEKTELTVKSSDEFSTPGRERLHFVQRSDALPEYDESQEEITGYDANLMRARVTLSSNEEKKLLRRIDWHLIPLLSVMYMLKTIDFQNVSLSSTANGRMLLTIGGRYRMRELWIRERRIIFLRSCI